MTSPSFYPSWSMQPSDEDRLDAMVDAAWGWGNVAMSRKHDGFRVLCRVEGGKVDYFSRNGLSLPLHDFDADLLAMAGALREHLGRDTIYFDAECCGQTFEDAQAGKQGHGPLILHIFDAPLDDSTPLRERLRWMDMAAKAIPPGSGVSVVKNIPAVSRENVFRLFTRSREWGWEGLVLKDLNAPYRAGVSPSWVRLVHRVSHDLPVIRVIEGTGRARGGVGVFVCEYQGREVKVMPGCALREQRVAMLSNPPKVIEVESRGETGKGALRHAAFVRARGDKAVPSHDAI